MRPAIPRALFGDAASIFGTQLAALGLQFLSGVLVARALGPAGRGTYAIVTLIPATVVAVGGLGMGSVVTHWAARELAPVRVLFGNVLLLAVGLGFGYACALAAVLNPGWSWLAGVDGRLIAVMCGSVPLLMFNDYALALLLGRGGVGTRNVAKLLEAGALVALTALLVAWRGGGVLAAALAWAASGGVVAIVGFRAAAHLAGGGVAPRLAALRPAVAKGLQGALAPACTFLLLRSDLYLVSQFLGPAEAGRYAVAASLANLVLLLPTSVGSAFLPKVSRLEGNTGRQLGAAVCRLTTTVTVGACLALAILARSAIALLYGPEFAAAAPALLALLPGVAAAGVGLVLATDLQGRGIFHTGSIATGLALLVNVLVNLFAVPRWGILGAAVSSSVAYSLAAAVVLAAYARGALLRWYEPLLPRAADVRALLGASTSRSTT